METSVLQGKRVLVVGRGKLLRPSVLRFTLNFEAAEAAWLSSLTVLTCTRMSSCTRV